MRKTSKIYLIIGLIFIILSSFTITTSADGIWPVCGRVTYNGHSVKGAEVIASCEGRTSSHEITGLFGFYSTTINYKSSARVTIIVNSNQYGTFTRTVDMDVDQDLPLFENQFKLFLFVFFNCRVDLNENHITEY